MDYFPSLVKTKAFWLVLLTVLIAGMALNLIWFVVKLPGGLMSEITHEQMLDIGLSMGFNALNLASLTHLIRHKIVRVPLQLPLS